MRKALADSSVNVYLVGLAFDRQKRNPPCLQYVELWNDKLLIDWVGQAGVQPGRASLHLAEFDTPISCGTTSFLCFQLQLPAIIQVHEGSQFGSTLHRLSLLRLQLDRRLAAGLGIHLVDFAS